MFVVLLTLTFFSQNSFAAPWEFLASDRANYSQSRDTISIGRDKGKLASMRFVAEGNDVRLNKVLVAFGNGERKLYSIKKDLIDGRRGATISFPRRRFVRNITLHYRSLDKSRSRGVVNVLGSSKPIAWKLLGRQKVNLIRERDEIFVGRRKGRFSKLQLRVQGNDIFFKNMVIVFGNGRTQVVTLGRRLREGTRSRAIDLKGRERFVSKVILRYRRAINFRGRAFVSVHGK